MTAKEFTQWVKQFQDKMFGMACAMLNDETWAKDAVQDVFLKMWEKRELLHTIKNPEAWLIKATKNRCLDILKKAKPSQLNGFDVKTTTIDIRPDEYTETREMTNRILSFIKNLSLVQRAILYLRETRELEYSTIAVLLDISVANVKTNVFRYRQLVKKELLKKETWR